MYEKDHLGKILTGELDLDAEAYERALSYVARHRINIDEALIALNIVDFKTLGMALERLYALPYKSIKRVEAPKGAWEGLSPECALKWGTFPLAISSDKRILSLVVPHPRQAEFLENLYALAGARHTLAFYIASKAEIDSVLGTLKLPPAAATIGSAESAGSTPDGKPSKKSLRPRLSSPRGTKISEEEALHKAHRKKQDNRPSIKRARPRYKKPSEDIKEQIIEVSRKVSHSLEDRKRRLNLIREKVRYAKLLCLRLELSEISMQRTVLASWLSAYEFNPGPVIKEVGNPLDVMNLMRPPPAHRLPKIEQRIISLVNQYLSACEETPEACRNLNQLPEILRPAAMVGDEGQRVLGEFLEVLRDERLFSEKTASKGNILIVDNAEYASPTWTNVLAKDGFTVEAVATLTDARRALAHTSTDLIIIASALSDGEGITFSRELRASPTAPAIVCLLPLAPPPTEADLKAAGANDVWPTDLDPVEIQKRTEKLVNARPKDTTPGGLQGDLSQLNLVDMIQILSASALDMNICLRDDNREGQLYMQGGELIRADLDEQEGQEALFALLSWDSGEFSASACKDFPPPNLTGDTLSLLMEAARVSDESQNPDLPRQA